MIWGWVSLNSTRWCSWSFGAGRTEVEASQMPPLLHLTSLNHPNQKGELFGWHCFKVWDCSRPLQKWENHHLASPGEHPWGATVHGIGKLLLLFYPRLRQNFAWWDSCTVSHGREPGPMDASLWACFLWIETLPYFCIHSSLSRFLKGFILDTDASATKLGAMLLQVGDDRREHIVAFGSHELSKPER